MNLWITTERDSLLKEIRDLREFTKQCTDPRVLNERREAFNRMTIPFAELAMTATLQVDNAHAANQSIPHPNVGRVTRPAEGTLVGSQNPPLRSVET